MRSATKGPLTVKKSDAQQWIIQLKGQTIAIVNSFGAHANDEENARLFAASPELLHLAEEIVEQFNLGDKPDSYKDMYIYALVEHAKRLIKLAKGGT